MNDRADGRATAPAQPNDRPKPPSPRHPDTDTMPPYSPGGVPEPRTDEKVNPGHEAPAYPPKRAP